jgi:hypothetical protein
MYKKVETLTFQFTLPQLAGFPVYKELKHNAKNYRYVSAIIYLA